MLETIELTIARKKYRLTGNNIYLLWNSMLSPHSININCERSKADVDLNMTTISSSALKRLRFSTSLIENHEGNIQRIHIEGPYAYGSIERNNHGSYTGRFKITTNGGNGLRSAMRVAVALASENYGGLLLHASAVWLNNEVWLFCGPSGSGKSTIAIELRKDGHTFAEDGVVLEFDNSGTLIAHTTPFGNPNQNYSCPYIAPVAGLAFIYQADKTQVTSVSTLESVMTLFTESQWYSRTSKGTQRVLETIARIVQTRRCFRLEFTRDEQIWSVLSRWRKMSFGK